jgi:hypothetical protein
MGCNTEALWDFEGWAAKTGCGSEPIEGTLLYHTAWTGPIDRYREEFGALIDSWLMTQDTARSEFHFWCDLPHTHTDVYPHIRGYTMTHVHTHVH